MQKKNKLLFFIYLVLFTAYNCQTVANPSSDELIIKWKLIENNYQDKGGFLSQFTIINKGSSELSSKDWNLYFNFPRMVDSTSVDGNVSITHVNGDFFKLTPKENFKLKPKDSLKVNFVSGAWALNQSDAPAGLYIVFNDPSTGKEAKAQKISNYLIEPFTQDNLSFRFSKENPGFITNEGTFKKFSVLTKLKEEKLQPIVPSPVFYEYGKEKLTLDNSYRVIGNDELKEEREYLTRSLNELLEAPINGSGKNIIQLLTGNISYNGKTLESGEEAYQLSVKPGKIIIKGTDKAGVFYGIQSLKALFPAKSFLGKNKSIALTEIAITDYPAFHYRGIHLDVARNFQSKESILQLLDVAAFYKLNKFHFHITDDEGWRLEIPSLPELTEVGSKRPHSSDPKDMLPSFGSGPGDANTPPGSGFYTKAEFIEILKYAKERHIEVIPELDLPGHARAAVKSMDARYERLMKEGKQEEAKKYLLRDLQDKSEYLSVQMWKDNVVCVCQPSVYSFIETVVKDINDMYKEANATLTTIHTGGDEVPAGVWEKSPVCQSLIDKDPEIENHSQLWDYYLENYDKVLDKYKLATAGWEEIALMKKETENGSTTYVPNPKFVNKGFIPYVWNNINGAEDLAYKLANAGYPVILSAVTNLYFDMAYNPNPEEIGYYWGGYVDTRKTYEFLPLNVYYSMFENGGKKVDQQKLLETKEQLTEKGKQNILGIQGQLWSENTTSTERQQYFIFPKLLAFSEVAWSKTPSWANGSSQSVRTEKLDSAYNVFANTLGQKELVRLDYLHNGIEYRISPPGAIVEKGILKANVEFPGFTIRYTTDGSEPTVKSPVYNGPVAVKGTVKLKTFASNGRSSRSVLVKAENTNTPLRKP